MHLLGPRSGHLALENVPAAIFARELHQRLPAIDLVGTDGDQHF